jgi:cyclase
MIQPRLIPVLLLRKKALVKSIRFREHKYIGDPINVVRIFNDLKCDEFILLDIDATKEKRLICPSLIREIGEEANMPLAAGGGIKTLEDIRKILEAGAERVVINTQAGIDPAFVNESALHFGSSTIIVAMDIKRNRRGEQKVYIRNGEKELSYSPVDYARLLENNGAGEIIIQSIENDGMMSGYDIQLTKSISESVSIPVIALGGAGKLFHMKELYRDVIVNGLAAGSLFVYQNTNRGVLVNYPNPADRLFDPA